MDEIRQRLLDRYDIDELVAVLKLSVEDILDAFEEKIDEQIALGNLDV